MRVRSGRRTGRGPRGPAWEHFPHGADIGVRGRGATMAEAFEQVALAMSAIVSDPGTVGHAERVDLSVASADAEILLVKWLNAIIYEMAVRSMVFSRFEVRIEGGRLEGSAWGEPVDVARHQPAVELKGATLTALSVAGPPGEGWLAQCVVDV